MTIPDRDNEQRLAEIERRLEAIESAVTRLLAQAGPDTAPPVHPPPFPASTTSTSTPGAASVTPPPLAETSTDRAQPAKSTEVAEPATLTSHRMNFRKPREPWGAAGAARAGASQGGDPQDTRPRLELEQLIGGRIAAAVGALIVVAGLVLAARLAWDAGWLRLSDAGKCWAAALAGAALLTAGEVIRRVMGGKAAAALFGAGVGALYAAAWAASGRYQLIPTVASFLLMAGVAAVGIAVALHARLLTVAVLAVLGAYAAPVLSPGQDAPAWAMPLYLMAVTGVGLTLSAWRGRYRPLRIACWWPMALLGTLWMLRSAQDAPLTAAAFSLLVWSAFHAELLVSARRPDEGSLRGFAAARPIISSFSTSAWAALWLGTAVDHTVHGLDWMGPAAFAVAAALLAFVLSGHLRLFVDPPKTPAERLGVALLVQAGGLLVGAVGWGISGWMQGLAGLALGVCAAVVGRAVRSGGLVVYGVIVLLLATLRVGTLDLLDLLLGTHATVSIGELTLAGWNGLALITAGCWLAAAEQARALRNSRIAWFSIPMHAIGAALLAAAALHPESSVAWLAGLWSMLGLGLALVGAWRRRPGIEHTGDALLVVALASAFARVVTDRDGTSVLGLFLNDGSAALLLTGIAILTRALALVRSADASRVKIGPGIAVVGAATLAGTVLNEESEAASISVAYLALAVMAAIATPTARRLRLDGPAGWFVVAGLLAWAVAFTPRWGASTAPVLLHPGMWLAFVFVAVAAGALWLFRRVGITQPWGSPRAWAAVNASGAALVLISTSLEAARSAGIVFSDQTAERGALSIWWGVFAVGLLVAGAVRAGRLARYAGLSLLFLATAKAVLFDLAAVNPGVRVASFIGLGLMLLGVSVGYLRLVRRPRPGGTAGPRE